MASGNTGLAAGLAKLRENAKQVKPDFERTLDRKVIDAATDGEAYMKTHAPWKDDEGNRGRVPGSARAGLTAVADVEGDTKSILFSHGVDWGVFLETKNNGKDEIIMPSVYHEGTRLMESMEGALNKGSNLFLSRYIEKAETEE